jgi:hypothetical protein
MLETEKAKHTRYARSTARERMPSISRVDDTSNQIDPAAIEFGSDVRVTVMLRNIPNRMNCVSPIMNKQQFSH